MATFVCTGNAGKLQEFAAALSTPTAHNPQATVVGIPQLEAALSGQLKFSDPPEPFDSFLANAGCKLTAALHFLNQALPLLAEPTANSSHTLPPLTRVLVDDSGLCCPAFEFEPGVHSATFGGLPRSDAGNRAALRSKIAALAQSQPGSALLRTRPGTPEPEWRTPGFFVCFLLTAQLSPELLFALRSVRTQPVIPGDGVLTLERHFFALASGRGGVASAPSGFASEELPFTELLPYEELEGFALQVHFGFCAGEVSTVEQTLIPGAGHGYDCLFYPTAHPEKSFASVELAQKNALSHRAMALQAMRKCGV